MADATDHHFRSGQTNFERGGLLNGDIWHPLARSNNAADDQQPCAALPAVVQQLRPQHHRLHGPDSPRNDPPDGTPNPPDEENAGHPTEAEGYTGQVQGQEGRRSSRHVVRDDGPLQDRGRKPGRLSWSDDYPDADLDRLLPGDSPHDAINTRRPGKSLRPVLWLEPGCFFSPVRQSVHRYFASRPCLCCGPAVELRTACSCWRFDVYSAEDDHEPNIGPTTEIDQPDDAVDDADYVRCLHVAVPGRVGRVHPIFKHYRRNNSVLRRRKTTSRTVRSVVPWYRREQG